MRRVQQPMEQQQRGKNTALIVLAAFERGEDGDLRSAFEAQQMPSWDDAVARAKLMSPSYAGVIALKMPANPDEGEFGEPEVLWQHGEAPDLE